MFIRGSEKVKVTDPNDTRQTNALCASADRYCCMPSKGFNMKIEIIICTENGYLEAMSKLLVYSIRQFGGILKDALIFSYKPRKGKALKKSTIVFFEKHNVNYIDLPLNKKYANYPLANKPIVCAHRENHSNADVLIFLDSDTVFFKYPVFWENINHGEVLIRPVDTSNIGSDKFFSSPNGNYWKRLYHELRVHRSETVCTTIDNKEILEYYNSGMIVSQVSNGLFQNWNDNFEKVMDLNLMPRQGIFFVEQSVLSSTISAMNLNVKILPKEYNCPVHLIDNCQNPAFKIDKFRDLVHMHYHKVFMDANGVNPFFEKLNEFKVGALINEKIVEFGVSIGVLKKIQYDFADRFRMKICSIQQKLKMDCEP